MATKKQRITLSLDDETVRQCDEAAQSLGLSRSAYVSFLINSVYKVTAESTITPNDIAETIKEETEK